MRLCPFYFILLSALAGGNSFGEIENDRYHPYQRNNYLPPPQATATGWIEPVEIVPLSKPEGQLWRYTETEPGDSWFAEGFRDADWKEGPGGFGAPRARRGVVRTEWTGRELWLRRTFELPDLDFVEPGLFFDTLGATDVYINGVLAVAWPGYVNSGGRGMTDFVNKPVPLSAEAVAALRPGLNLLAVHTRVGPARQYADIGLTAWIPARTPIQPAFPGAHGFGQWARGGRGGQLLFVDNLALSGPGSLQYALDQKGPRTILFRVSGTIEGTVRIRHPYVTLAGQTAPGDGICIQKLYLDNVHDVVIRNIRLRGLSGDSGDGNARNSILDHVSASWGDDEVLSNWGNTHAYTVQNTIIAESHEPHAMGSLAAGTGGLSYYRNLYAHHNHRTPRLPSGHPEEIADIRNNVIYNFGHEAIYQTGRDIPAIQANIVGNYFKPGPSTPTEPYRNNYHPGTTILLDSPAGRLFVEGNYYEGRPDLTQDNWGMVRGYRRYWDRRSDDTEPFAADDVRDLVKVDLPHAHPFMVTWDPRQLLDHVLDHVGAWPRDEVCRRVVESVRTGTGRIMSAEHLQGLRNGDILYPNLRFTEPHSDTSGDGMPDWWKKKYGLDPTEFEANDDLSGDGFTNLEAYLSGIDPRVPYTQQTPPPMREIVRRIAAGPDLDF